MILSLSKKGFDTVNGGGPSPILSDGRMLTMPIPEPRIGVHAAEYGNIQFENYTYQQILRNLGHVYVPLGNDAAHLDPDLIAGTLSRAPGWRGLFGQVDQAQGHLANQGVGTGSLFLFWGWFENVDGNGLIPNSRAFSAIFGYLEVDFVINVGIDPIPPYAGGHPHFANGYPFQNNCVYVARQNLSWNPQKSGWGVFNYHPRLRLSIEGENRSNWKLPGCFHHSTGCNLSYNTDEARWGEPGLETTLKIPAKGQEFVCHASPEIEKWAHNLIDKTEVWI